MEVFMPTFIMWKFLWGVLVLCGGVEVFVLGGMCIIGVATKCMNVLFFCPHAFYPPFE